MTAVRHLNFSAGELSPSLYARVDQARYQAGLKTCRNFYVKKSGGVENRPGFKFVAEVKTSSQSAPRLIPFIFNSSSGANNYVLEFGNEYIRFHQNAGQVVESAVTITSITAANPAVVTTSGAHGYSNNQEVYISGVSGMTQVNGRNFKVTGVTATTYQLRHNDGGAFDATTFSAGSGGTSERVYEIASPYSSADLSRIKFVQNADRMTLVHPDYEVQELVRTSHTSWSIGTASFVPEIAAPTSLTDTDASGAGASPVAWVVTAIDSVTNEESLVSNVTLANSGAPGYPVTLSWVGSAGASLYYIYRRTSGNVLFFFIGQATTNSFIDTGPSTMPEIFGRVPPNNPFGPLDEYNATNAALPLVITDNFPSSVGTFQQRMIYGLNEDLSCSRTGLVHSFWVPFSNISATDPINLSIVSDEVAEIRHIVDVGRVVIFTSSSEWILNGSEDTPLTPTNIDARRHTSNGCTHLRPLLIDKVPIYVQERGSIVRDFLFDFEIDGYRGNDLTVFSSHLVDGYTISDWAFQKTPDSIVWMARSDGKMLSLTYIREHQVVGWARHDTDGLVESVCTIPEGSEDKVYVCVKRTIPGLAQQGGTSRRYIERLDSRSLAPTSLAADPGVERSFCDSFLSYDGRHTAGTTAMTLTGGTNWTYDETLTLTANVSSFASTDVGNAVFLYGDGGFDSGTLIRCTITAFSSPTIVSVMPHKTVPVAMREVEIYEWALAVDQIGGLWHLEGESISVQGDGFVIANANDATGLTVSGGIVTLPEPYSVIHAGLPYVCDLQTLDLDLTGPETIAERKKLVTEVNLYVHNSRGGFCGIAPPEEDSSTDGLAELRYVGEEDFDNNLPIPLATSVLDASVNGRWSSGGQVFVRQIDPAPLAVLAIMPIVQISR